MKYRVSLNGKDYEIEVEQGEAQILNISDTPNSAPIAVEQTFETYADLALHGTLKAVDPDGDACTFSVERQGKRGTAEIDGADFCYTPNGKSFIRGAEDIEICFNNCFKIPYIYKVAQFAEKMSFSLRAVDTALAKACMPTVALFENENQLKKFDKFTNPETAMQPFVGMIKEKLVSKEVEMLSLYDATKIDVLALWDVYVRYRNLFYTTIGINNVEVQKRERLTEAEGAGNDEITRYSLLDDMSNCRRDFCDRCKKHFNSEIDFEINRDIATVFQIEADNEEKMRLAKLDFTKGTNPANETETEKAEDIEEPKEPKITEVKE